MQHNLPIAKYNLPYGIRILSSYCPSYENSGNVRLSIAIYFSLCLCVYMWVGGVGEITGVLLLPMV
jgi:hypothetical protein